MIQLQIFEPEIKFERKSRGDIYTDKIWNELSIHQKINIKVNYGIDPIWNAEICPNYMIITRAFENGFDMSPFIQELGSRKSYHFMHSQIRKVKPV